MPNVCIAPGYEDDNHLDISSDIENYRYNDDFESGFSDERVIVKFIDRSGEDSPMGSSFNAGLSFGEIRLLNPFNETDGFFSPSSANDNKTQDNVYVLTLAEPGADAVMNALEILRAHPDVEYAEPDYFRKINTTPKDPFYNAQYALGKINAPSAWAITTGSKDIVVGIIDTGMDGTHPDLKNNLWVNPNPNQTGYANDIHGYDFSNKAGGIPTDANGHGTHCAGIIGAVGNNFQGIVGINWNVS
jgi:subtilisin family serine protease